MKSFLRCFGIATGLLFLLTFYSTAQTGKTFWFVAPDATDAHKQNLPGTSTVDPDFPNGLLCFRITNLSEQPASGKITMPANGSFTTKKFENVGVGKQVSVYVTHEEVENFRTLNGINNKGILIESDQDVAVYYDIDHRNNPDKFTLKGDNALGTEFLIPSQNDYFNHKNLNAKEKVDIVATQANTTVSITPTANCIGHLAGVEFKVDLNLGETYCLEAVDDSKSGTLSGTYISSNNNIAVTISDDSIEQDGHINYDIIGDQLIPTSVLGTEYIAIRTNDYTTGNIQKVYILATEDGTTIDLGYGSIPPTPLNRGQSISIDIALSSLYIKASAPVYVYQVTGYGFEMGSAVLPPITCTGSTKVSIKRNLSGAFWVQIMVKAKDVDSFKFWDINGTTDVYADFFKNGKYTIKWIKVDGTTPANVWVTGIIDLGAKDATLFGTKDPYILENSTGKFHLSVLDANGVSLSYGYFSAYNSLSVSDPTPQCKGTDITLTSPADKNFYDLKWYLEPNLVDTLSTQTTYQIKNSKSGKYILMAKEKAGGCESTAAIDVKFLGPDFQLPEDATICSNANITLYGPTGTPPYKNYLWEYNTSTATTKDLTLNVTAGTSTNVSLTVTDDNNCAVKDEMTVNTNAVPPLNLQANPTSICIGQKITSSTIMDRYQWYLNGVIIPNAITNEYVPTTSGKYTLSGWTAEDCVISEDLTITVNPLPVVNLATLTECNGSSELFSGPAGMTSYLWHDGSTGSSLSITQPTASITLDVTDGNGCKSSGTGSYAWWTNQNATSSKVVCPNDNIVLQTSATFTNYAWTFQQTLAPAPIAIIASNQYSITNALTGTHDGTYIVTADDEHACLVTQTFQLKVDPIPALDFDNAASFTCVGQHIVLKSPYEYDTYSWTRSSDGYLNPISTERFVEILNDGAETYRLRVTQGTCSRTDEITVSTLPSPSIALSTGNAITGCENTTIDVDATPSGGNGPAYSFQWMNDQNQSIASGTRLSTTESGTFTVVVYDSQSCTDTATVVIDRHPLTTFTLADLPPFCDNTTITLQIPATLLPVNGYQWRKADNTANGPVDADWVISDKGSYVLDITDINGCAASASTELIHNPSPTFDLGADMQNKCDGDLIEVKAKSTFGNYYWNGDLTAGQPSVYTIVGNDQVQTISLRITSSINNCESEKTINVITHTLPSVDLGSDIDVCAGIRSTLTAPDGMNSILWTTPEGTTPAKTIIAKSGYHILAVSDASGCKNTDTINIVWRPLPVIDLGPDELICPVDQVMLDAGAGSSYLWEPSNEVTQTIMAMTDTVTMVRVQGINGCWGWDTKVVYEKEAPEYVLSPDTAICSNDSLLLDADPDGLYHTFLWSDGIVTPQNMIKAPGDYWVEVQDGCFVLRDTTTITFLPTPVIAQLDTMIYQQIAILSTGGTSPYQYAINDDEYQSENVFRDLPNGTYVLWVQDSNLCTDSTTVSIFNSLDLNIPNFITPNGDGQNDTWSIKGLEKFPESNIRIYDRYGKLLRLYKPTEPAWDGRYLNKPLASDDYWYVVELNPTNKLMKGNITLKR